MKKITLLLMAVLAWVGTVGAQEAQSPVTFNWAHSVEGTVSQGGNTYGMQKATDGSYYVASSFQTKGANVSPKFDGIVQENIKGSSNAASNNYNFLLQKVTSEGNVTWNLYSKAGDVSEVNLAATSDDGVVLLVKSRVFDKEAEQTHLLEIVDATGHTEVVDAPETKFGEYRFSLLKVTSEGKVAWQRVIYGLVKDYAKGSTLDNAYITSCVVDASDHIYLGGNFRTSLSFPKADATTATITATNTLDEYFNTQNSIGDLFLVKLDKDGNYQSSLVGEGTCTMAYIDNMVEKSGKLYVDGRVKGEGYSIGGKNVTASAAWPTLYVAALNSDDLSVDYVNTFGVAENSANKFDLKNRAIDLVNGNLYLTGALNGSLSADDKSVNTGGTQLMGYIVKVNAETGKVLGMNVHDAGISAYLGVYEGNNDVYAFCYNLMKSQSYLVPFAKDDLSRKDAIVLSTAGSDVRALIVDGNRLVLASRGKKGSTTFTGTDFSFTNSIWAGIYYSYSINDVPTGISRAEIAAASGKVDVYTISGVRVKANVSASEAMQGLAKGIYVVGNKKVVIK